MTNAPRRRTRTWIANRVGRLLTCVCEQLEVFQPEPPRRVVPRAQATHRT